MLLHRPTALQCCVYNKTVLFNCRTLILNCSRHYIISCKGSSGSVEAMRDSADEKLRPSPTLGCIRATLSPPLYIYMPLNGFASYILKEMELLTWVRWQFFFPQKSRPARKSAWGDQGGGRVCKAQDFDPRNWSALCSACGSVQATKTLWVMPLATLWFWLRVEEANLTCRWTYCRCIH